MNQLPSWMPGFLLVSSFVYTTETLLGLTMNTLDTSQMNPLQIIITVATFQAVPNLAGWAQLVLFLVFTVPLLFMLYSAIAPIIQGILSNTVLGIVAGILLLVSFVYVVVDFLF